MLVRFAYISDVHFGFDRVSEKIAMIEYITHEEGVDLLLSGGDFDYIPLGKDEFEDVLNGVPLLSVYGNHDRPEFLEFYGILMEDGVPYTYGDITICGFGGAVIRDTFSYPETWNTPDYYLRKYLALRDALVENLQPCDILITHESPLVVANKDAEALGYWAGEKIDIKSYRNVFDVIAGLLVPKIYLCGHIHSSPYTLAEILVSDYTLSPTKIPVLRVTSLHDNTYAVIDYDEEIRIVINQFRNGESKAVFETSYEKHSIKPI